jgi:hypothetical protein
MKIVKIVLAALLAVTAFSVITEDADAGPFGIRERVRNRIERRQQRRSDGRGMARLVGRAC